MHQAGLACPRASADLRPRLSERARQEGIGRFTATVSYDNVAMSHLLRSLGAVLTGHDHGVVEYEILLQPAGYGLDSWFRHADNSQLLTWP